MLYYALVTAAVVMFGLQFFCNQKYQEDCGSGLASAMVFSIGNGIVGLIALLILNRFRLETTPFTLVMATVASLNGLACCVCGLKALSRIDLSLYSLFNMLGGMALPFCAGILLFGEALSIGKAICLLTVAGAMLITLQRGDKRGGTWYYIGIFTFNGLSGVIATFYQTAAFAKADETSYSIWGVIIGMVIAAAVLAAVHGQKRFPGPRPIMWMGLYGILNKVANLLLLIALAHLPASVQYPMVTGGVMIVSTLLAYLTPQKPSRRELVAMLVSFIGIMFLFID